MPFPRLIADIGGTNARFGLQREAGGAIGDVLVLPTADHATPLATVRAYLAGIGGEPPREGVIGIATSVTGDRVSMTNHPWSFSTRELQDDLHLERLLVINDFTALALALPALRPDDLLAVGSGVAVPDAAIGLLGAGTGLGVGGLMPTAGGGHAAISGEGGHATLAAGTPFEAAVVDALQRRFGHASAERALSGPGLVNLFEACAQVEGRVASPIDAATISERALAGGDAACSQTVELFFALLGSTAGNLALTLGARGGVFIGGGIVPRLKPLIAASPLRERFEAKGRFRDYLSAIPLQVIVADFPPALTGAARALDRA